MRLLPLYALIVLLPASLNAYARTKKTASPGAQAPVVLEATQQRTNPGRRETEASTEYRFVIIWKGKSSPTAFFWRPDAESWMEAGITRSARRPGLGPNDYMLIEQHIAFESVHNGDTIVVTVKRHVHDEDPMPSMVKKMPLRSLYYQTAAAPAKWYAVPVNVRKLPDLNRP